MLMGCQAATPRGNGGLNYKLGQGFASSSPGSLKQVAHAEQAGEVVNREPGRGHSARWQSLDKALALKHLEGAANRSSADAEIRGELVLHESSPFRRLAVDDRHSQFGEDASRKKDLQPVDQEELDADDIDPMRDAHQTGVPAIPALGQRRIGGEDCDRIILRRFGRAAC